MSDVTQGLRAQRAIHIVGACIIALTAAIVIAAMFGGRKWAKQRQMRAIQQVAVADLRLVADAEKTFYTKHGFYTTDLKALNLWPKRVLYAFGFVKPADFAEARSDASWNPERRTIALLAAERAADAKAKAAADPTYRPNPPIVLSSLTSAGDIDFHRLISFCPDCTATPTTFKVVAAAQLDEDPVLDIWVIDHAEVTRHLIDDLQ